MEKFKYGENDCACPGVNGAVTNIDTKVGYDDDCACPTSTQVVISNPDCACPNVVTGRLDFQEDCANTPVARLESIDTGLGEFLTMSQTFPGLAVIIHLAN